MTSAHAGGAIAVKLRHLGPIRPQDIGNVVR